MTAPRLVSWRVDTHGLLHARIEAPTIRRRRLSWPWTPTNLRVVVRQSHWTGVVQANSIGVRGHRLWGRTEVTDEWNRDRGLIGGAWDLTTTEGKPHPMPPWLPDLTNQLLTQWKATQ